jgi:putative membrane protein
MNNNTDMRKYWILVGLFLAVMIVSAIHPHDYFTWILEVFPAILGFLTLLLTFNKFRFTTFTYSLILVHCTILFIGGHYTYAHVPFFDWVKEALHQSRNNYDKVGHFAQGFIPAVITRELLIRNEIVKSNNWIAFFTVCICLSISVLYEFIEWFVAIVSGQSSEAFLGTQGDVWDTQSDMLFALIGATCMVLLIAKMHDKQIKKLP